MFCRTNHIETLKDDVASGYVTVHSVFFPKGYFGAVGALLELLNSS